jgi:hypothetical protein
VAEQESGVRISLREIYDTMQEVKNEVKGIAPLMKQIEKDAAQGVEALDIAREAQKLAQKHEDGLKWLWRAVGAALITGLVGAIIAFMVLAVQLSVQNEIKKGIPQQQINVESPTDDAGANDNKGGKQ